MNRDEFMMRLALGAASRLERVGVSCLGYARQTRKPVVSLHASVVAGVAFILADIACDAARTHAERGVMSAIRTAKRSRAAGVDTITIEVPLLDVTRKGAGA